MKGMSKQKLRVITKTNTGQPLHSPWVYDTSMEMIDKLIWFYTGLPNSAALLILCDNLGM